MIQANVTGNLARRTEATPAPSTLPAGYWSFGDLAGRITELSGFASTTMAISLLHEAQLRREPTAWITCRSSTFFPPDVDEAGVDLATLPVIFVADERAVARAADHLLRSGSFGLVVLDIGARRRVPMPLQSRLVGLARKHETAILFLTDKIDRSTSLSCLVSLRASSHRQADGDRYGYRVEALKDKKHGPGWFHQELRRGPTGVC